MDKNLKRIEFDKVLDVLSNEAISTAAKDKIKKTVPSHNFEMVKILISETLDAYKLSLQFEFPSFDGIVSIENIIRRVCSGATLQNREFLSLLSTLRAIRLLKIWKESCICGKTSLDDKFNKISPNKYLENKIREIILSESEINDNASEELFEIRSKMRRLNQKIRKDLEKLVNSPQYRKYLTDSVVINRSGRFLIQVKSEHRGEVKGIVQGISASGATVFIEPMGIVEEDNRINELEILERKEIDKILFNLSRETENFADNILISYNEAVNLDEIFAKASLAVKMDASVPEINQSGIINLKKAKHPLIPREKVQPIDISLGDGFNTLIITGPNTGGKTVAIKTVGLMCAMAMSGMMIPAHDGSSVSVFDEILTDIGDEQSIEQSVSTFSSHMGNIINVMKKVSDKTLVLLDEIGSGTDPEEGAAISIAILNYLRAKKAKTIVTTHYKELKEYAVSCENVECAGCEFDLENLKPTYRILMGSVGNSNAFLISERLGMEPDVIKQAKNILGDEKIKLNDFLIKMEKTRKDLEIKNENIDKLYSEAKKVREEINKEKERLENNCEKILSEARFKAKMILDRVKIETQNLIKDLNTKQNHSQILSSHDRHKIKKQINNLENLVDPIDNSENHKLEIIPKDKFQEGDCVFISGFEKEGTICSHEDEQGNFMVLIGRIKTKVAKSKLRPCRNNSKHSGKKSSQKTFSGGFKKDINKKSNMQIDIRGKTALEACQELELFLDGAFISGLNQVTIIHGKGSGILRKEVHEILRKNRQIKNFRLGDFNEGGDGVTVVSLK